LPEKRDRENINNNIFEEEEKNLDEKRNNDTAGI
jgi:hypothetical protein